MQRDYEEGMRQSQGNRANGGLDIHSRVMMCSEIEDERVMTELTGPRRQTLEAYIVALEEALLDEKLQGSKFFFDV